MSAIQYQERNFTSFPDSRYLLPSDEPERARYDTSLSPASGSLNSTAFKFRLDRQHQVITRCFGNNLVLSPLKLVEGDKVLDSGAGACSWVLDLASTLPKDVEVFGSDIENRLFPMAPPRNVKLFNYSVLGLPKEWTNIFQLVHQRLLECGLTRDQWDPAIKELFRVTKPGGWVELCETGPEIICPSHPNHKSFEAHKALYAATEHILESDLCLPERVRKAGFIDVRSIEVDMPFGKWAGANGDDARDTFADFIRGLKGPILSRGGLGIATSEEEYEKMVNEFERICDETPGTVIKYYTVCGRKPVASKI